MKRSTTTKTSMKQLPHIAAALYCEPWCIRPNDHSVLCDRFRQYLRGEFLPDQRADDAVGPKAYDWSTDSMKHIHPQVQQAAGLALVEVKGIIGKGLSMLEMRCGGYDLALFGEQLQNIIDDGTIKTLVINFDTPGGRVTGVELAAQQIMKVRAAGIRVIGYTSKVCASAGYWLASACDEFYAEGSAIVGSISTVCAGVDSSRNWEMEGLKLELFVTGSLKAIGYDGQAWTEEQRKFMQDTAEAIDGDFKSFVKAQRALGDELMNGAYWFAKHAPAGLVDGIIPSLDNLLEAALAA